ncbi:Biogenesis of lysosome-related organelles complex 1 subunit 1 [Choanephora cucurbitarum]|uniref:Biogenesis of lysosome-related organelles complex 1 subunit 1 n=1 Tax=Choanephora cucurbitarum TaxID=101091 RepID=A0A1C7MY71_9FUNG|nr:Biogenesis of lysosome-related organelles complex 1 subunit 1 [Choanephora cucurbitarum]
MSESLAEILKAHQQKQANTRKENEQLKQSAIRSTQELTDALSDYASVSQVFLKQKELEQQSRKLANQTTKYANQTQQWLTLVDNFNMSLKELGDVRNWAEMMEYDMKTIMTTLEFVHQGTTEDDKIPSITS